ncbi:MAG: DUF3313 family protein [Elstera sp.]
MLTHPPAIALLSLLLLGACANQQTTNTGFIQAQAGKPVALVADAEDADRKIFAAPPAVLAGYHSFILDEVTFRPGPKMPADTATDVRNDLKQTYADALRQAFSVRLKQVQQPGPGVLRVKAAITGYERANVALNVVTTALVGPVTAGGAASEAIVVDSQTQTPVLALATHSNGTPLMGGPVGYYTQHGHARRALARHAEALAELMAPAAAR